MSIKIYYNQNVEGSVIGLKDILGGGIRCLIKDHLIQLVSLGLVSLPRALPYEYQIWINYTVKGMHTEREL